MKAQQVIAVVKKATATAPHPLKALSHGVFGVILLGLTAVVFAFTEREGIRWRRILAKIFEKYLDSRPFYGPAPTLASG